MYLPLSFEKKAALVNVVEGYLRIPVGQHHHHVKGGASEHQMEERPRIRHLGVFIVPYTVFTRSPFTAVVVGIGFCNTSTLNSHVYAQHRRNINTKMENILPVAVS